MKRITSLGGFTLVELSIVLVILGLLAAGILVGRDLIETARIRAQISQIEKLNTSVNTFRVKYGGLPGDLKASEAQAFGFTLRSGAASHGDGNGTLEACIADGLHHSDGYLGCETVLFWNDLYSASLIAGSFTTATDDFVILMTNDTTKNYLPKSALPGYLAVFSDSLFASLSGPGATRCEERFCYSLVKDMNTLGNGRIAMHAGLTTLQIFSMDTKMDDGRPLTGKVLGGPSSFIDGSGHRLYYISTHPAQVCRTVATNSYNVGPDEANDPICLVNFAYQ